MLREPGPALPDFGSGPIRQKAAASQVSVVRLRGNTTFGQRNWILHMGSPEPEMRLKKRHSIHESGLSWAAVS